MDNDQGGTQPTIENLLLQIIAIDQGASFNLFRHSDLSQPTQLPLALYLQTLARTQEELARYRTQEEEYKKLEMALQRQETEMRKRISIEQQLKLYTDALKVQVEEIEKEKLELLENSKVYIKSLKSSNEKLFAQLERLKGNGFSSHKKNNKSLTHSRPKHDRSIRQIIKTEYIERNQSNSGQKKKPKPKVNGYSTISHDMNEGLKEKSKTFYIINKKGESSNKKAVQPSNPATSQKEKINPQLSSKRNKYLFSNYTLLNYLESSNRKLRKGQKHTKELNSPGKRKKESNKKGREAKNTSVMSMGGSSNKKETI